MSPLEASERAIRDAEAEHAILTIAEARRVLPLDWQPHRCRHVMGARASYLEVHVEACYRLGAWEFAVVVDSHDLPTDAHARIEGLGSTLRDAVARTCRRDRTRPGDRDRPEHPEARRMLSEAVAQLRWLAT